MKTTLSADPRPGKLGSAVLTHTIPQARPFIAEVRFFPGGVSSGTLGERIPEQQLRLRIRRPAGWSVRFCSDAPPLRP